MPVSGSGVLWQMDKEDKEKAAQEPGGEAAAKPEPEPAPKPELRWVGEPAAEPAPAPKPELRWVGEPAAADATIDATAEAVPEEAQATGPAAADAAGEKAEPSEQAEVRADLWVLGYPATQMSSNIGTAAACQDLLGHASALVTMLTLR